MRRKITPLVIFGIIWFCLPIKNILLAGESQIPLDIVQFLSKEFEKGIPIALIKNTFNPDNVKKVSEFLNDKCPNKGAGTKYQGNSRGSILCKNAITTLGVIGDEKSGRAILEFLNEGGDQPSRSRVNANALLALGTWVAAAEENIEDLVEKESSEVMGVTHLRAQASGAQPRMGLDKRIQEKELEPVDVINGLINCIPDIPEKFKGGALVEACPPSLSLFDRRDRDRIRAAIMGLGLSGSMEAKAVIIELKKRRTMVRLVNLSQPLLIQSTVPIKKLCVRED